MKKIFVICSAFFIACLISSSAQAKAIAVQEYDGKILPSEKGKCSGEYSHTEKLPADEYTCVSKRIKGTNCWKCTQKCGGQYKDCGELKGEGKSCQRNGKTLYERCVCPEGFHKKEELPYDAGVFEYNTKKDGEGNIVCYQPADCKNGKQKVTSDSFTIEKSNNRLVASKSGNSCTTLIVKSALKETNASGNFYCATGSDCKSPCAKSKTAECAVAETDTSLDNYLDNYRTERCKYLARCTIEGACVGSDFSGSAVFETEKTADIYNPTTGSNEGVCYKVIGCKTGLDGTALKGNSSINIHGQQDAIKTEQNRETYGGAAVCGLHRCNTADGWEIAAIGTGSVNVSGIEEDGKYEVAYVQSGDAYLACRKEKETSSCFIHCSAGSYFDSTTENCYTDNTRSDLVYVSGNKEKARMLNLNTTAQEITSIAQSGVVSQDNIAKAEAKAIVRQLQEEFETGNCFATKEGIIKLGENGQFADITTDEDLKQCASGTSAEQSTPETTCTLAFHELWDGRANTAAIVAQLGDNGGTPYAAKEALDYYVVSASDPNFGKGKWYLPALGELMEMWGVNYKAITSGYGQEGMTKGNFNKINNALKILSTKEGSPAESISSPRGISSASEAGSNQAWYISSANGNRSNRGAKRQDGDNRDYSKINDNRYFRLLENKFEGNIVIGDIVYNDFSHTSAENYNNSKTPVGVVAWVSDSGRSAKIMSLKKGIALWGPYGTNITAVTDYDEGKLLTVFQAVGNGTVNPYTETCSVKTEQEQYFINCSAGKYYDKTTQNCLVDSTVSNEVYVSENETKVKVFNLAESTEQMVESLSVNSVVGANNLTRAETQSITSLLEEKYGTGMCFATKEGIVLLNESNSLKDVTTDSDLKLCPSRTLANGVPETTCTLSFHVLWDGFKSTKQIVESMTGNSNAANRAFNYYIISSNDANFGKGKWYLPTIEEWMDACGINYSNVIAGSGTSGATGEITVIMNALQALSAKGVAEEFARTPYNGEYWSSSQLKSGAGHAYTIIPSSGERRENVKSVTHHVRAFNLLKNKFDGNIALGDVVYKDLSYGKATDYDGSKTPVGVVVWVSPSKKSAKIINLRNLAPSSWRTVGPINIEGLPNYSISSAAMGVANGTIHPYTETCTQEPVPEQTFAIVNPLRAVEYEKRHTVAEVIPLKAVEHICGETKEDGCPLGLWNGHANTVAIVEQLGMNDGTPYAARRALEGYWAISEADHDFGKGKWYLPALGEWLEVKDQIIERKTAINKTLNLLKEKQWWSDSLMNDWYWTSSEAGEGRAWAIKMTDGSYSPRNVTENSYTRPFMVLENVLCHIIPEDQNLDDYIQVGDIIWNDKSWSTSEAIKNEKTYQAIIESKVGSRKPVGIVVEISDDRSSIKIMALHDAHPESLKTNWGNGQNIVTVKDYSQEEVSKAFNNTQREHSSCFRGNCDAFVATSCVNADDTLYSGNINTEIMMAQGSPAATYARGFYATYDQNHPFFGKGKWYIPAIGEWLGAVGVDYTRALRRDSSAWLNEPMSWPKISQVLKFLKENDSHQIINAVTFGQDHFFWTSSEKGDLGLIYNPVTRKVEATKEKNYVRPFLLIENQYCDLNGDPAKIAKVGDILYNDLSYESISTFDPERINNQGLRPMGIVVGVSDDGGSIKIMALQNAEKSEKFCRISNSSVCDVKNFEDIDERYVDDFALYATYREIAMHRQSPFCGKCTQRHTSEPEPANEQNSSNQTCISDQLLYDGEANTLAINTKVAEVLSSKGKITTFFRNLISGGSGNEVIENIAEGYAAYMVKEYSPIIGKNPIESDPTFGKGKWYLPAIGEWMEALGVTYANIVTKNGEITAQELEYKKKIQDTLNLLKSKNIYAEPFDEQKGAYWTSNEIDEDDAYAVRFQQEGIKFFSEKKTTQKVNDSLFVINRYMFARPFMVLQNEFCHLARPEIGDVVYQDKSIGKKEDYNGAAAQGRKPVGVVAGVSDDGGSVKVLALSNVRQSTYWSEEFFIKLLNSGDTETKKKETVPWMYLKGDQLLKLGNDEVGDVTQLDNCSINRVVATTTEITNGLKSPFCGSCGE